MSSFDVERLIRALTGGMGIEQFDAQVREQRPAYFAAALSPMEIDSLYALRRLESLVTKESLVLPYIDLFDEQHLRRLADVHRKSGKSALDVLVASFRSGSTVRVRDVDDFDAPLAELSAALCARLAADCQINVYLTPPGRIGFPPHFDITDVLVVQCLGSKRWRLFDRYANATPLPLTHTTWDPERYAPEGTPEELTMSVGDVLYLPRGTMHSAFCTDRESLHLTISVTPLTWADVLSKVLMQAAEADLELRRRVPWTSADVDRLAADTAHHLRHIAERADVGPLLRSLRGELRGSPPTTAGAVLETTVAALLASREASGKNDPTPSPAIGEEEQR